MYTHTHTHTHTHIYIYIYRWRYHHFFVQIGSFSFIVTLTSKYLTFIGIKEIYC